MTDNVLTSPAFNEPFTLYLNIDGVPVQRTLRDMTAGEVMQALKWANAEAQRLDIAAQPARKIAEAVKQGRTNEVHHLTRGEFKAVGLALRQATEASEHMVRLLGLVEARLPEVPRDMPLSQALQKWWPGGRAA
jgi:hypothetical protein